MTPLMCTVSSVALVCIVFTVFAWYYCQILCGPLLALPVAPVTPLMTKHFVFHVRWIYVLRIFYIWVSFQPPFISHSYLMVSPYLSLATCFLFIDLNYYFCLICQNISVFIVTVDIIIQHIADGWRRFAFLTRWNSVHLQVLLSATPQGGMFLEVSHPQALLGSLVSISWKFQFTKIVSEFVINF